MTWLVLALYLLIGLVLWLGTMLYCIANRRHGPIDATVTGLMIGPESWLLFLLWPALLPWLIWKHRKDPPSPGPTSIPTQVSTHLVGRTGHVLQDLRPSGRVTIDEVTYDAFTSFGIIPAGTPITVTAQDSLRLEVRPLF